MRVFTLCILLVCADAAAQPAAREALVREIVDAVAKSLDRSVLVQLSLRSAQGVIDAAAKEAAVPDGLPPEAMQREIAGRVENIYRHFYNSDALIETVLRPWVEETFSNTELEQLSTFVKTTAGRKFVAGASQLQNHIITNTYNRLQPDLAASAFGVNREDIVRGSRIKRTAADMRTIATASEAYATDHNRYPDASDMEELKKHLSPIYVKRLPMADAWERPYHYIVSADGKHYRIVSGGADGIIDRGNLNIDTNRERDRPVESGDDASADLVYQDGTFHHVPRTLNPPRPVTASSSTPAGYERIGGDVRAPVVVHRVEPVYPQEARAARISGIVIVETLIDSAGNVAGATVLKPLPFGLDIAALEAIRQWRFSPATKNGVPVPVVFNLTINFKVSDAPPVQ